MRFSTKAIHVGEERREDLAPPLHQSTVFVFERLADMELVARGEKYVYTRFSNPTLSLLEKKIAALEGGEAGIAFASGMAAISALTLSVVKSGDHIISTDIIYGSTHELFEFLQGLGIEVSFVDTSDTESVEAALRANTKLVFLETPTNPTMKLSDIKAVVDVVKDKNENVLIAVDNTFMTPYFQRPLELGADVVVHSATKYLCGHGDAMGGIVVGSAELISGMRRNVLKDFGGVMCPFNAWLIIRGLKTLAVRMERHEKNAMAVARFLEEHPRVKRVYYPGLESFPQFELAKRQMHGFGGMLSFEIGGGMEAARRILEGVRICKFAVSLGTTETLIEHPYTMTHRSFPNKEAFGITECLIRLSVGLEDAEDIIEDLKQALEQV
ncbi:MAG: Cystathionine beta-lyase/cystathionine gamma-synthase [Candidatus Alkanophagales archaeon MCA70_species_1]|nr:Cystathionine beta-lyase/cystathionine gamma-synthase [Candidatus Alkanophaga volatiphilum]